MNRREYQNQQQAKAIAQKAAEDRLKEIRSKMNEEDLFYSILAENLRKRREENGYTGEKEASKLNAFGANLRQIYISRIENLEDKQGDCRKPSIFEISCFSKLFKRSVDELIGLPDPAPLEKQRRSSVSFTGLSENALSTIRSLDADQKNMLDKILTCTDDRGENIFGRMLSEMVEADKQREEIDAAEEDFEEWHKRLVYFDSICQERTETYEDFIETSKTSEYSALRECCQMIKGSYYQLYLPALDQEKSTRRASSLLDDLMEFIVRSSRSETLKINGPDFADALTSSTLYGIARRAAISQGGDNYPEPERRPGDSLFSFPMDDYFEANPHAVKEFDKAALCKWKAAT